MSSWILLAPQHPNDPAGGAETLLVAVMLTDEEIEFLTREHEELGRRQATDDRVLGVELACGSMHVPTHGMGDISDELSAQRELLDPQDLVVIRDPELVDELDAIEWDDTTGDTAHLDGNGVRWSASADEMEYHSGIAQMDSLRQLLAT
jgi:hypothetical protein